MGIIDKDYGMPNLPDQEKFTIYKKSFHELPVDIQLEVLEYFINSTSDVNIHLEHALQDLKAKLQNLDFKLDNSTIDEILRLTDYICSDTLNVYKDVVKEAFKKAQEKKYFLGDDGFIYEIK